MLVSSTSNAMGMTYIEPILAFARPLPHETKGTEDKSGSKVEGA